ncbi:hypothetical protein [Streptomyces sp. col6]|uniref:hypothetical protein n=1 Tax=Streptomyces sp. col6 TaxID=2478958 RepID=UPI001746F025|nr:hypothetical protein [Streptomyces sp. col6]
MTTSHEALSRMTTVSSPAEEDLASHEPDVSPHILLDHCGRDPGRWEALAAAMTFIYTDERFTSGQLLDSLNPVPAPAPAPARRNRPWDADRTTAQEAGRFFAVALSAAVFFQADGFFARLLLQGRRDGRARIRQTLPGVSSLWGGLRLTGRMTVGSGFSHSSVLRCSMRMTSRHRPR